MKFYVTVVYESGANEQHTGELSEALGWYFAALKNKSVLYVVLGAITR